MQRSVVEIVPYRPTWVGDFQELATQLRLQLQSLALRIDHIGSTSVQGLAAKDRIDIQVTIATEVQFEPVSKKLEELGYQDVANCRCDHVPPFGPFDNEQWVKRFFRPPAIQRATNLHVRINGMANQVYPLLFRDYLRQHPASAAAYAELKKQLAAHHGNDSATYCDIKDPVCDLIAISAQAWAISTGWKPGASDA